MPHHRLVWWERWGYEGGCRIGGRVSGVGVRVVRDNRGVLGVVTGVLIHTTAPTNTTGRGGLRSIMLLL